MDKKDLEILKTIYRVRVARVDQVESVLFTSRRTAQRRFARLRERGLIIKHEKGLSLNGTANGPKHYRLTKAGVELLVKESPQDDYLAPRHKTSHRLSLRNHEHHDGLVALYINLSLIHI